MIWKTVYDNRNVQLTNNLNGPVLVNAIAADPLSQFPLPMK